MAINRFGDLIASAHAGMTAEGDNSVLMQKVAKEHLGMFKPHAGVSRKTNWDLTSVEELGTLFKLRENEQYDFLRNKIGKAMVFTKVIEQTYEYNKAYRDQYESL